MGLLEDIDSQLQKLRKKIEEKEDPVYIRADCPRCGKKDIKIHKMRARHGHTQCPECGEHLLIMMKW